MKKIYSVMVTLLCATALNAQLTQTVTSTQSIVDYSDPSPLLISVPKFNSADGILTGVNISINISNNGNGNDSRLEHTGTNSGVRIRSAKRLSYDMDILATTSGSVNESVTDRLINSIDKTFSPYDGVLDYGGVSGVTNPDSVVNINNTYSGDVALFNGSAGQTIDVLAINLLTHSLSVIGGGGNYSSISTTEYDITITVTYTYSSSATLPLTLISFSGKKMPGSKIEINWKTSYEENIDYFDLEYSLNGQGFEKLATINAKNDINGAVYNYTHFPGNVNTGVLFYRLKYTELDGKIEYSNVIRLGMDEADMLAYKLYPNPVSNGQINISGKTASGVYRIYTSDGKMAMSKLLLVEGTVLSIDIGQLQKGYYFIQTPDAAFVRFVVLK